MLYSDKQEMYDGEWQNDRRSGEGRILRISGESLEGEFRNGEIDGRVQQQ